MHHGPLIPSWLVIVAILYIVYRYFGFSGVKWAVIAGVVVSLGVILWLCYEKGMFDEYFK